MLIHWNTRRLLTDQLGANMAKTLMQRYAQALTQRGETKVAHLSRCDVYTRTKTISGGEQILPEQSFWYLGLNGSVRFGKNRTMSIPLSDMWKKALLAEVQ